MTELLIAAVSGAGLTIGVAVIVLVLSLKLSASNGDRESARVQVATLTADNKAKDAALATAQKTATQAQEALDALDAEYQKLSASAPVDGAYQRLLSQWSADRAAARGGASPVQAQPAPVEAGPDGLLDPFQG